MPSAARRQGVGGTQKTVADGPHAEAKEVTGGYSIVVARGLDQAPQIASGYPILAFGGSVKVHPVYRREGTPPWQGSGPAIRRGAESRR